MNELFQEALEKIAQGTLPLANLVDIAAKLVAQGQVGFASQLYQTWCNNNPNDPQLFVALFNGSAIDSQLGNPQAAIAALQRALEIHPGFMPAAINLGGLLERSGKAPAGLEVWRTAVNRPTPINGQAVSYTVTALKQMARVLNDHGQLESAEATIRHCLDIEPMTRDVMEQYVAVRLAQCKWPIIVPWERVDRATLMKGIHPLSVAVFTDDPLLQLGSADYCVRTSPVASAQPVPETDRRHAPTDVSDRRIRVGYVSSDLRDHAIGYLMSEFFERHDKSKIEVFAYYCGPESTTPLQGRIKAAVEHWTDIKNMTDDEAARAVANDGIDILVDVNGHTRDAKPGLFARRPAPIIVNWLGYPGTMGTPYHNYIVADEWIIPQEAEMYYTEKVVRLPCYQPNDRKRQVAATPTRQSVGLPDDAFVFCCFNGTHKINRFTFERWVEILSRVPNSVLWLLDASDPVKNRLGDFCEQRGVDRSRLIWAPKIHNALHLARYPLADLFLDTNCYGAHTTASDALWMGVPVLTLMGRGFAARVCGSLVHAAGMPEFVVTKPEDYIERAVAIGLNPKEAKAASEKLKATRDTCTLFDLGRLTTDIESLYLEMCRTHQQGRTPRPNLTNLDAYLQVGVEHDHDAEEVLAMKDYHGRYKAKLAQMHAARPLPADGRIWTAADIAIADSAGPKVAVASKIERAEPKAVREDNNNAEAPQKRRKTGTR